MIGRLPSERLIVNMNDDEILKACFPSCIDFERFKKTGAYMPVKKAMEMQRELMKKKPLKVFNEISNNR